MVTDTHTGGMRVGDGDRGKVEHKSPQSGGTRVFALTEGKLGSAARFLGFSKKGGRGKKNPLKFYFQKSALTF